MNFEEGHFFHIYGRANSNYEILFKEEANYFFFLKKYQEYLSLFFHTICYCLLPNHFHFLVKVVYLSDLKNEKYKEIENYTRNKLKPDRFSKLKPDRFSKPVRFEEVELEFSNFLVQKISNFLNCYTKSFNKVYNRRGSLFQRPTKSKHISSENYLQRVVRYIHNNPQKHKYINEIENWQFSSYPDYVGLPLKPDRFTKQKPVRFNLELNKVRFTKQKPVRFKLEKEIILSDFISVEEFIKFTKSREDEIDEVLKEYLIELS